MTKAELENTIEYLKDVVWKLEDRDDGDRLKDAIDHIKGEIKKLEARHDAL